MKDFLLNAFLCIVGFDVLIVSGIIYNSGGEKANIVFYPALIFIVITFVRSIRLWKTI